MPQPQGYVRIKGYWLMKKIGLLAGVGRLPVEFARAARGMGFAVIAIALLPEVDEELSQAADVFYPISVGELERILTVLKQEEVTQATMIGKVTKELLFSGVQRPDARLQKLLLGLPDHKDDTIMLALVKELASEGVGILDQTALLKLLMPAPGVLTERRPTPQEEADMKFGFTMAKHMGDLDIGQTVVIKNCAVMAVEAIEGTDACIRRGGELGRGGVTVVKTAKPGQDMRFDVPSIGLETIRSMVEAGATALALEAGKTLLVERPAVLELANRHQMTIVAV